MRGNAVGSFGMISLVKWKLKVMTRYLVVSRQSQDMSRFEIETEEECLLTCSNSETFRVL